MVDARRMAHNVNNENVIFFLRLSIQLCVCVFFAVIETNKTSPISIETTNVVRKLCINGDETKIQLDFADAAGKQYNPLSGLYYLYGLCICWERLAVVLCV